MKPGSLGRGKGQRGREADTPTTWGGGRRLRAVCEVVTRVLSTDRGPLGEWAGECWGSHLPEAACGWAPALGKGKLAQLGGREKVKVKSLSRVQLFGVPWTVAHQAPLSMGLRRHEYWSGLPFPSPGDHPNPGIKPGSPALQADALRLSYQGSAPVPGKYQGGRESWEKSWRGKELLSALPPGSASLPGKSPALTSEGLTDGLLAVGGETKALSLTDHC